jgi:quinol monooxygenase YgiN
MVRYKTLPERADENERLIRAVFEELRARSPGGLRYATFRLEDGVSFVHIATHAAAGENPLTSLPSFKAFQQGIKERCVELPVLTELRPVGVYDATTGLPAREARPA